MEGERYAVLIASSQYPKDPMRLHALRCPEKDVEGLQEILTSQDYGFFTGISVLKNAPHYESTRTIHRVLRSARKDDLVLIYYSGHGKLDLEGSLYLATADTEIDALEVTSIPVESIRKYINLSPSRKVILILDCCYSGRVGDAFLKSGVDDQLQQVQQVQGGRGLYILTASTGIQVAQEKEGDQYSLLTKYILEGIKEGKADVDDKGFVSIDDLYRYSLDQMRKSDFQEPMKWDLYVQGDELVIARTGKTPGEKQRERTKQMLYDLLAKGILPYKILTKAVEIIELEKDHLSETQAGYHTLLNQLIRKRINIGDFILAWQAHENEERERIRLEEQQQSLEEEEARRKDEDEERRRREAEDSARRAKEEQERKEADEERRRIEVGEAARRAEDARRRREEAALADAETKRKAEETAAEESTQLRVDEAQRSREGESPLLTQTNEEQQRKLFGARVEKAAPQSGVRKKRSRASHVFIGVAALAVLALVIIGALIMRPGGNTPDGTKSAETLSPEVKKEEQPSEPTVPTPPEGMVYVPGGEFTMGRDDGDEYERPAHREKVKPFFIGIYEVTNEEYEKFVKQTGHSAPTGWKGGTFPVGHARRPVTGVTWYDAIEYAEWAGKMSPTKKAWRLPTEEEWEYAARGPDSLLYPWGNKWEAGMANADKGSKGLVDVGSYTCASHFGVYDMVGNAWEWTASELKAYPGGTIRDTPNPNMKVIRGCMYNSVKNVATATCRAGYLAKGAVPGYLYMGFRLAKDVE